MDFGAGAAAARAIDGVSLAIGEGETVCLVGESGCGKSVTAQSIARLVPAPPAHYVGGEILAERPRHAQDVAARTAAHIRGGVVSYVFQEPGAALNPVFRIGAQIREALKLHRPEKAQPSRSRPPAETRRHPGTGVAQQKLSVRAVRRHAAAGDDRDGTGERTQTARGRRADDRSWT